MTSHTPFLGLSNEWKRRNKKKTKINNNNNNISVALEEKLHELYSSPSIIRIIKERKMRWAGHVARLRERRNAYRLWVGKPEGRRPLGRPKRRWLDNIRMNLEETGCSDVDWIALAQDRNRWRALANSVLNLRVP
jgi:hypothetical protein